MEEGIYFDIPEEEYHKDPCPEPSLSASIIKVLLNETPQHAWQAHPKLNPVQEESRQENFDLGKTAHSLILRDPKDFVIIKANAWRTNAAKELRDTAYDAKKIPILKHQWDNVALMVKSAKEQLIEHECGDAFAEGSNSEVTLIWREDNGVWCRIRIDNIALNKINSYDYKTTGEGANPESIDRMAFNLGWDIISAFYKRGIRKLMKIANPNYRFVVQENYKPHCLSVIGLEPSAEDLGERKVAYAINLWGKCIKENKWPGYPKKVCYIKAPSYKEVAWYEREIREQQENREETK